jgi:1-deoxy-D-xylulose-5-phosphate reductoisomerase
MAHIDGQNASAPTSFDRPSFGMSQTPSHVAVLGSTGSIGQSALEVVSSSNGALVPIALAARSSVQAIVEQARRFYPRWVVLSDPEAAALVERDLLPSGCRLLCGSEGLEWVASQPEVDIVLAAVVGSAGLRGTWAALDAGKTVALANKETLVMAGPLVVELARRKGARLLPVDSEHSAIFQCLKSGRPTEAARIILTASGGPFRTYTPDQLSRVTVADALSHPTWSMGPKITVDSATLMNKALEIVEARWLFGVSAEQIQVVIHPQSIVHSMVEFVDGSVVAQLGPPDMKLPIHYALHYPRRVDSIAPRMGFEQPLSLDFEPPDVDRFPALLLGWEAARAGGTTGAVLNAANEAAVAAFLDGELPFSGIVPACQDVLANHDYEAMPSLERLIEVDEWARQEVSRWVSS